MSPALEHEGPKKLFGRMVETLTEEMNIPIKSGGSTTYRRKLKKRGLEPDECYWIAHELSMRGKTHLDLETDPPPDLAMEVENTQRLIERLPVYAALGFPEIWRCDGQRLEVGHLQDNGSYRWDDRSTCFPFLPMGELVRFLSLATTTDETTWIRSFRAWVRAALAAGPGPVEG